MINIYLASYLFKWRHEYSTEIKAPLSTVFDFHQNMNNWTLWQDDLESFKLEKICDNKKVIIAKVRNRNFYLPIIISEIEKNKKCQMKIKSPLSLQISKFHYEEISPALTRITFNTTVSGFLTPFLKYFYKRKANAQYLRMKNEFSKLESVS